MTKLIALVAAGAFAAGTMFAGDSQPDSRSEDEDGNGDDRTPQSGVYGSNRGQVHEGCRGHPHSGPVREVQSGVQQGEERKGRRLTLCFLKRRAPPLLSAENHDRARFGERDLRTHEIFTLLSLWAAYTAGIGLQLLPTAGFCRNGDKRGNDQ
jgi:hypothetical protein